MDGVGLLSGALGDPSRHSQVCEFVESMKKDGDGWKKSINNIISNNIQPDEFFILLQVVEDFLVKKYTKSNEADLHVVRQLLSHCIAKVSTEAVPSYLMNKMAHVFSLVFAVDFPVRWPSFMQEVFLGLPLDSPPIALFYLKTLLAIDSEVVDREIQRAPELIDRNTRIKDAMRVLCVSDMTKSWLAILDGSEDAPVQSACLEVLAVFIEWIDIELVANEHFVPLIIQRLSHEDTCEAAVMAITAVLEKKMVVGKKLPLVWAISEMIHKENLLRVTDDPIECSRAGQLLSALHSVLIDSYHKLHKEGVDGDADSCLSALAADSASLLEVLDQADEEVSTTVVDVVRSYVMLLLTIQEDNPVIGRVVEICLRRYEMGEDLELDSDGQNELEFVEYRKELRNILHTVGIKKPELLIVPLESFVDGYESSSIRRKESIAHLVYSLAELMPSGLMTAREGWLERAARLPLRLLTTQSSPAPDVLVLHRFEMAVRYEKLLPRNPPCLLSLTLSFLADDGIGHTNPHVRSRIIYLFSRFVKSQKAGLADIVPQVIARLAPLLAVCNGPSHAFLSPDDQGFLFESTATLIVNGKLSNKEKAQYITELVTELANKFTTTRVEWEANPTDAHVATLQSIVGFAMKVTKAFGNNELSKCSMGCVFLELLSVLVQSLSPSSAFLSEGVRQYASRLVVCLEGEMLPVLSSLIRSLASLANDADGMQHLLILAQAIVAKHKNSVVEVGIDWSSLCSRAIELCQSSGEGDSARPVLYLRRMFLQFLVVLLQNDVFLRVAPDLLDSMLECVCGLASVDDATTQKTALSVLSKVCLLSPKLCETAVRVAVATPLLPHFQFSDAASALVLHEVGVCLSLSHSQYPEGVSSVVSSVLPSPFSDQLILALSSAKGKELDRAIQDVYQRAKAA